MNNFPKVEKKFGRLSRIEQLGDSTKKILMGAAPATGLTFAGEMHSDATQTIATTQNAASSAGNAITLAPPSGSDMAGDHRIAMHESPQISLLSPVSSSHYSSR